MKVIIAGGGTGGHIFPAVAIANALKAMDATTEILFVGANGKMEMEKVPKEGYKIIGLDIVGFNRSNLLKNIFLPWKLWKSRQAAMGIIKEFNPDVVVGVGGFASFPMLNAAQAKSIPTLIQEQNSYAGKTNKILAQKAKAVCVAYDNMDQFFPKEKIIKTGNPVRILISKQQVSKAEAAAFFDVNLVQPTLLIVGGSLGARSINEAVALHMDAIVAMGFQVIWQTGKSFVQEAKAIEARYPKQVKSFEFIYEMDKAYAACDMIISRAGALAIAEICIVAKPTIFVPYPYAAEDHQTSNARALVDKNAAAMIKDSDVKEQLLPLLKAWQHEPQTLKNMAAALDNMAIKDADIQIANKVKSISLK